MAIVAKQTEHITAGNLVTIQQRVTLGNAFDDSAPSDNLGGPGPYLVFEKGIWKYPEQAQGGRFAVPNMRRPLELVNLTFNLGSSLAWTLNLEGNPSNTSGTPYDAADAALYLEGSVEVDSGTDQYLARNYAVDVAAVCPIIHPGQYLWFGSAALAAAGVVRMTFRELYDGKS